MSNRRRTQAPLPASFVTKHPGTYWNGEHAEATRTFVRVADSGRFPEYWAREHVGTVRAAVRVQYGGRTFHLDDEDGSGWRKVTEGRGAPSWPHRDLEVSAELLGG